MSEPIKPDFFPTRAHMLACTGPKCGVRGKGLFVELWNAIEREGIAYYSRGGTVRLTESGCLGACAYGPNIACYVRDANGALQEAWYYGQTLQSAIEIARAVQTGAALPSARRYDNND